MVHDTPLVKVKNNDPIFNHNTFDHKSKQEYILIKSRAIVYHYVFLIKIACNKLFLPHAAYKIMVIKNYITKTKL